MLSMPKEHCRNPHPLIFYVGCTASSIEMRPKTCCGLKTASVASNGAGPVPLATGARCLGRQAHPSRRRPRCRLYAPFRTALQAEFNGQRRPNYNHGGCPPSAGLHPPFPDDNGRVSRLMSHAIGLSKYRCVRLMVGIPRSCQGITKPAEI